MKSSYLLMATFAIVLSGCATHNCEKVEPYQMTVATEPLKVPADLSEPPLRSQAPEVDPNAPKRRADGGCLELPPAFEPEENKS